VATNTARRRLAQLDRKERGGAEAADCKQYSCSTRSQMAQIAEYALAVDNDLMLVEGYRSANSGVALAICPGRLDVGIV